jgi:hypothetical protein
MFMRDQLSEPIPSPVVLGQITEKFREAVKALADREQIPSLRLRTRKRKTILRIGFGENGVHAMALSSLGWHRRNQGLQRKEDQRTIPVRP